MGVGIASMRERLEQFGGKLEVDFGRGGTTIRAYLPLRAAG
jgi:signal transduction histidine kinase